MKLQFIVLIFMSLNLWVLHSYAQGVAINEDNSAPDPSAMLDVKSLNQGFLPPRMSTTERNAIGNPAEGLVVYDTNEESLFLYTGTGWLPLVTDSGSQWEADGGNIFRSTGNVGIGTSTPQYPLHLQGGVGVSWQVERIGGSLLRGTANINDASVGTSNSTALRLLTNNTVRMHVATDGKIGIGTVSPTTRLHLVGDLRIQDGTQGAGKVLTSDPLGNASWSEVDIYGNNTIVVDATGSGNFTTITAALNSVTPTESDRAIILIRPGLYEETISLKSFVTLSGADAGSVKIKGSGTEILTLNNVSQVNIENITIVSNISAGTGVKMTSSDVRFRNTRITGDWNFNINTIQLGIEAVNSTCEFIDGKIVELESDAILLTNSIVKVSNTELSAVNNNVDVESGSQLELFQSQVSSGITGIYIRTGGYAKLMGNTFDMNGTGVLNEGELMMAGNRVQNSTSSGGVQNSGSATITGNLFQNCSPYAIFENSTGESTITGNNIEDCSHLGEKAMIINNSTSIVSSNVFKDNSNGDILLIGAASPLLNGNKANVSGSSVRGVMAGIDQVKIERIGDHLVTALPGTGNVGIGIIEPLFKLHISDDETQRAIYVDHTSTSGTSYGVWARSAAISGTGIRGNALHPTGITYGVYGETESTAGTGVYAISTASTGTTFGLQSYAASSSGRAVYGFATAVSGTSYGIYGRTNSTAGYAGYFEGGRNYFQGNIGIGETSPTVPLHIKTGNSELEISSSEINKPDAELFVISAGSDMEIESGSDLSLEAGTNMDLVASSAFTLNSPAITIESINSSSIISDQSISFSGGNFINMNNNTVYVLGTSGVGIKTAAVGAWALAVNGNAAKPGGGSWSVFSDARLKHDIAPLQSGTLDKFLSLNGYTFEYDNEAIENRLAHPGRQTGLVAQEVQQVFPEWVEADDKGYLFVTERGLTAILVEAMRELRNEKDKQVADLNQRMDDMKAEILHLRNGNTELFNRLSNIEKLMVESKQDNLNIVQHQ
jgi:hypothetical protein